MLNALLALLRTGTVTQREAYPELPEYARGLPTVTDVPCTACEACEAVCPTSAVRAVEGRVTVDLGGCVACGECLRACPTGTLVTSRRTDTAVRRREDLVLPRAAGEPDAGPPGLFSSSLHVREVATGDSAADLEVAAAGNPIFDVSRFGVHVVASPRHADALLVTGPVGRAMQEPLRRCWAAMAEPRLVIAAGAAAISGGLHRGGYAQANGVDAILPVAVYVPGHPPHPWSLIHGLRLAMGHAEAIQEK